MSQKIHTIRIMSVAAFTYDAASYIYSLNATISATVARRTEGVVDDNDADDGFSRQKVRPALSTSMIIFL